MVTKAKSKTDEARKLRIADTLKQLDLELWLQGVQEHVAIARLSNGCDLIVCVDEYREALKECRWLVLRQPNQSHATDLGRRQWEKLREAVRELKDELRGRTLDEATKMVCSLVPTNSKLLEGLRRDLHFWNE